MEELRSEAASFGYTDRLLGEPPHHIARTKVVSINLRIAGVAHIANRTSRQAPPPWTVFEALVHEIGSTHAEVAGRCRKARAAANRSVDHYGEMIVLVEGPSAAGKTTWCQLHLSDFVAEYVSGCRTRGSDLAGQANLLGVNELAPLDAGTRP
jgi:hypothetical protein